MTGFPQKGEASKHSLQWQGYLQRYGLDRSEQGPACWRGLHADGTSGLKLFVRFKWAEALVKFRDIEIYAEVDTPDSRMPKG